MILADNIIHTKTRFIRTDRTACGEELQGVLLKAVVTGLSFMDLWIKPDQDVLTVMAVIAAGKKTLALIPGEMTPS